MTCPNCGTRAEEWKDDPDAYEPEAHFCRGCEIKARADEEFERNRKQYRRGTTIQLRRRIDGPDPSGRAADAPE